jgi:hypothetical protein
MKQVPAEIRQRGVSQEMWLHWVNELQGAQRLAPNFFCDLVCFLGTGGFSICTCRGNWTRRAYWKALLDWQNCFNEQVLIRLGMFCKTQSSSITRFLGRNADGTARTHEETIAWIAFALNPQESDKLKMEPHNTGEAGCCMYAQEEMDSPMVMS